MLDLLGLIRPRTRQLADAAEHFGRAVDPYREQGGTRWSATALSDPATTHLNAGRQEALGALGALAGFDDPRAVGQREGIARRLDGALPA